VYATIFGDPQLELTRWALACDPDRQAKGFLAPVVPEPAALAWAKVVIL
jgi:hypothetical protein